nr:IPT/TIG domain-containing protein [Candidatus Bipolaricaulota bacterium]
MKTHNDQETEDRPAPRRFRNRISGIALLAVALGLTSCAWFPWFQQVELALIPTQGAVRTTVNLVGEGFGDVQGDASVLFDGVEAPIQTWTDLLIVALVPVVPTPGGHDRPIQVSVWRGGEEIATASFTLVRGVLFVSRRDGNSEIYVMNPDGSQQTNLTN